MPLSGPPAVATNPSTHHHAVENLVVVVTPAARRVTTVVASTEALSTIASIAVLVTLASASTHAITSSTRLVSMETVPGQVARVSVCPHAAKSALLARLRRRQAGLRRHVVGG